MIRKAVVLAVLFWAGSVGHAALSFVGEEAVAGIPGVHVVGTFYLHSDTDGAYMCWLEITDPGIAMFWPEPSFTKAGNPNGDSRVTYYPQFGEWYEVVVASLNPADRIQAGDHLAIHVIILSLGITDVNLYDEQGVTLLDRAPVFEPEPATVVLLGVGVLCARRRNRRRR